MVLRSIQWRTWVLWAIGIATVFPFACAWIAGTVLIHSANHAVIKPSDFAASDVAIAGPGHLIAGWWVDAGPMSPVVLLLHGIRSDRSSMVARAQMLRKHGFSVLLIDLQAHGETPGGAITLGWRESDDVTAARRWIDEHAPGRKVGLIGCSLGGAAALFSVPKTKFDAMVLEAVYPRLSRAVENRVRLRLGPLAPVVASLLLMQIQPRLHLSAAQLEPIRFIGNVGAPVLVVAGSDDQDTTLGESLELYDAARSPKQMWVVHGARHEDFLAYDGLGYQTEVLNFLASALQAHPKPSVN